VTRVGSYLRRHAVAWLAPCNVSSTGLHLLSRMRRQRHTISALKKMGRTPDDGLRPHFYSGCIESSHEWRQRDTRSDTGPQ
jgi:hypothetical protein